MIAIHIKPPDDSKPDENHGVLAKRVFPQIASLLQASEAPKPYDPPPKRVSPEARILKVWLDHDQFEDGVEGTQIHVKFKVDNLKGRAGKVQAHFFQPDGQPLYRANGQLLNFSLSDDFKPARVNTTYEDFKLFMPSAGLRPLGSGCAQFESRCHDS